MRMLKEESLKLMDNTEDKYPNIKVNVHYGAPKDPGEFPKDSTSDSQAEWLKQKAAFISDKVNFGLTRDVKYDD